MTLRPSRRPHVVPITAPSFPTSPRTNLYRNLAYSFMAFTLVVVVAVLWLSSARATVTVKTRRTPIQFDGTVDIARETKTGQIPGRVVHDIFEKIQEFPIQNNPNSSTPAVAALTPAAPTSTTTTVLARGTVRIINKYSRAQTLVRTTRLLTPDQKLFRIDQTVRLEPGQSIEVKAYADKPGAEFVIGPSKFTIPGLFIDLQKFIYAESDQPFQAVVSNVSSVTATPPQPSLKPISGKALTQADLDAAEAALKAAVLDIAKQNLSLKIDNHERYEIVYLVKPVDRLKSNVSVGQAADAFLASIKLDVTAVFYPKEDVVAFTRLKLRERIPEGREFTPTEGQEGMNIEIQNIDLAKEVATLRVRADGAYRVTGMSPGLQKSVVAGKEVKEAIAILKSIEGVDDASITLKPSWLGKVPSLKDRIEIKIE